MTARITLGTGAGVMGCLLSRTARTDIPFPEAVRMATMIEPPLGVPDMGPVLDALSGLNRDISGIIEHDLYPCPPDIAKRTKAYLSSCRGANIDMGVVA